MENNRNSQILEQLETFFTNGSFEKAIEHLKANKSSFDTSVYKYNLAIAHLKNENPIQAKVLLEQAKQDGFYSSELIQALSTVNKELEVDYIEETSGFSDQFNQVVSQIPFDAYALVSLVMLLAFIALYKKMDKYIRIILLILFFLPISFYGLYVKDLNNLILLEDQVVYRGPSKMFEQIQILPQGVKVLTGKKHNGWRYIITPESHSGWFLSKKVIKL